MIGIGVSGSRTGAGGCGSVSGGRGIGPGFGFSGSDGSCGVTGGISGFSIESVNRLMVKLVNSSSPLFETRYSGRAMTFSPSRVMLNGVMPDSRVLRGFSNPWTISIRVMILGSVI